MLKLEPVGLGHMDFSPDVPEHKDFGLANLGKMDIGLDVLRCTILRLLSLDIRILDFLSLDKKVAKLVVMVSPMVVAVVLATT